MRNYWSAGDKRFVKGHPILHNLQIFGEGFSEKTKRTCNIISCSSVTNTNLPKMQKNMAMSKGYKRPTFIKKSDVCIKFDLFLLRFSSKKNWRFAVFACWGYCLILISSKICRIQLHLYHRVPISLSRPVRMVRPVASRPWSE